jgi:hypothetical protein
MRVQVIKISDAHQHSFSGLDGVCVGLLLAYFLHFALPALRGGFGGPRNDEFVSVLVGRPVQIDPGKSLCLVNVSPGPPARSIICRSITFFDPLLYQIVQIGILAATIPIFFCLAQLLSGSRALGVSGCASNVLHGQMASLVFTGSFIYEVLCGFFYFAALTYYVHIRQKGVALRPGQVAIFLALYVCALNSKEMAVSLPVIVFIYEALRCPRLGNCKEFACYRWDVAIPSFVAALVTAIYICGKLNGPHSLANLDAYRPVYSWHRFTLTNAHFNNELLYHSASRIGRIVLVAWPVLFLYAFWRRDRLLQLMAFWVVVTPLPLAFIPSRGGRPFISCCLAGRQFLPGC